MYGIFNLYALVIVKDCIVAYHYSKILVCVKGFDIIQKQNISYPSQETV